MQGFGEYQEYSEEFWDLLRVNSMDGSNGLWAVGFSSPGEHRLSGVVMKSWKRFQIEENQGNILIFGEDEFTILQVQAVMKKIAEKITHFVPVI